MLNQISRSISNYALSSITNRSYNIITLISTFIQIKYLVFLKLIECLYECVFLLFLNLIQNTICIVFSVIDFFYTTYYAKTLYFSYLFTYIPNSKYILAKYCMTFCVIKHKNALISRVQNLRNRQSFFSNFVQHICPILITVILTILKIFEGFFRNTRSNQSFLFI